jgi:hypothetical protein
MLGHVIGGGRTPPTETLDRLSKDLRSIDQGLRSEIAALEHSIRLSGGSNAYKDQQDLDRLLRFRHFRDSVDSVAATVVVASPNKHFDIPQPVSSFYTGRQYHLKKLKSVFVQNTIPGFEQQSRFVIHGIGGSGKTQICSKFAQNNRDRSVAHFLIIEYALTTLC